MRNEGRDDDGGNSGDVDYGGETSDGNEFEDDVLTVWKMKYSKYVENKCTFFFPVKETLRR